MRRWNALGVTRSVLVYLAISAFIVLLWLANIYLRSPSTPAHWAGLFLLALPVQLALEGLADRLWNNPLAGMVEERTRHRGFSLLRVGYALLHLTVVLGLLFAAAWLLDRLPW